MLHQYSKKTLRNKDILFEEINGDIKKGKVIKRHSVHGKNIVKIITDDGLIKHIPIFRIIKII